MATPEKWTDDWVRSLKHSTGEERPYSDPVVRGHRLVVGQNQKVFEIQCERPRRFGPRKTYKRQTGDARAGCTISQARDKAHVLIAQIRRGEAPAIERVQLTLLGQAWERFKARDDIKPSTLKGYESQWRRNLQQWKDMPLLTLVQQPALAEDKHKAITKPVDGNRSMKLLTAIYNDAAGRDTTLPRDRHPCTSVRWQKEKKREGAIPFAQMPAWYAQLEAMRKLNAIRASYHRLCLLLGTRPGELAKAEWKDFDAKRKVLVMPHTKTHRYEIPLSRQAQHELNALREVIPSHLIQRQSAIA